jgi:hypothetical protein
MIKNYNYFSFMMSNKYLILLILLISLSSQQTLTPIQLLPTVTTQNVAADYAFIFSTDTNIPHSASIQMTFPFEYDSRILNNFTGCYFAAGNSALQLGICTLNKRSFTIQVGQILIGNITILIKNIQNPIET